MYSTKIACNWLFVLTLILIKKYIYLKFVIEKQLRKKDSAHYVFTTDSKIDKAFVKEVKICQLWLPIPKFSNKECVVRKDAKK